MKFVKGILSTTAIISMISAIPVLAHTSDSMVSVDPDVAEVQDATTTTTTATTTTAAQSQAAPEAAATPAASDFTINGTVVITSDYRYRGVSYTDNKLATQGYLILSHKSGLYIGTFGSNLAGYGSSGGANLEADVYAGWIKSVGKVTFDTGVWRYNFPGTKGPSLDFFEVYSSASYPIIGTGKVKAGFFYAPKQKSIGRHDDLSVYAETSIPIKSTPISLKGHVGYTTGKGSYYSGPTGHYFDYLFGVDFAWKNLIFNVSYVDTSINRNLADSYYTIGGRDVIKAAVMATLTANF